MEIFLKNGIMFNTVKIACSIKRDITCSSEGYRAIKFRCPMKIGTWRCDKKRGWRINVTFLVGYLRNVMVSHFGVTPHFRNCPFPFTFCGGRGVTQLTSLVNSKRWSTELVSQLNSKCSSFQDSIISQQHPLLNSIC